MNKFILLTFSLLLASSVAVDHQWDFTTYVAESLQVQDQASSDPWHATVVGQEIKLNEEESGAVFEQSVYVEVRNNEADQSVLPTQDITTEVVIAVKEAVTWGGYIGCIQDNGSFEKGWILGSYENKFSWTLASEGGNGLTYMTSEETLTVGDWYHVVGTYDGDTMKLYVNGVLAVFNQADQNGPIVYAPAPLVLGAYKDENEFYPFTGEFSEASLFDRVFSEEEIKSRYEAKLVNGKPYRVPTCVTVYDECNYQGNSQEICNNTDDFDLNRIKSVRVPEGKHLKIHENTGYSGDNVSFEEDQECIDLEFKPVAGPDASESESESGPEPNPDGGETQGPELLKKNVRKSKKSF